MAAQSKKVSLQLGFLTIPVRMEKATDDEGSDTKTVCAGTEENPHPPARVRQSMGCTVCDIKHSSHYPFPRGAEKPDGSIVVLSAEELAGAAGEPQKKHVVMGVHSRAEVFGATVASDSVQNVTPDAGGERAYAALLNALLANPDLVVATIWAPSTKNALWVLEVVGDRLVASKRCWPENVRPAPVIAEVEVPKGEQDMMNQFLSAAVTEFNLTEYKDTAREGRKALIAERSGEAQAVAPEAAPAAVSGDMYAALQASLKQLAPKPVKKTAAKRAPRKRAAKKATAPAEGAA